MRFVDLAGGYRDRGVETKGFVADRFEVWNAADLKRSHRCLVGCSGGGDGGVNICTQAGLDV